MKKLIDEVGKRYGRLVVIRREGKDKRTRWLCRCDCGNKTIVSGSSLQTGTTRSCGCLQKESRFLPPGEYAFNKLYYRISKDAKRRRYEWNLTKDQVRELIKQPCFYCNCPPLQIAKGANNGDITYNGLDRIDNTKGYSLNNVVPCCKYCNKAKSALSIEEFRDWIERIYKHFILGG